jgi:hypothetical protein
MLDALNEPASLALNRSLLAWVWRERGADVHVAAIDAACGE